MRRTGEKSRLGVGWRTCVLVSARPSVSRALTKVLATLGLPCDVEEAERAHEFAAARPTIGLLVCRDEDDFKERFLLLDSLGCWWINVFAEPSHFESITQGYPLKVRQETEGRCAVSRNVLHEICRCLSEMSSPRGGGHVRETAATRLFRAEKLFDLTRHFLHDQSWDITNLVLGPTRMLLIEPSTAHLRLPALKRSQREVLRLFQEKVIQKIADQPHLYGELGRILVESFSAIRSSLKALVFQDHKALLSSFDTVLTCLTKSREDARQSILPGSRSDDSSWVEPLKPRGKRRVDDLFRVLVVDDFASSWRPVLEDASKKLEMEGLPTVFEFSVDGKRVFRDKQASVSIDQALPSYDLVLLDIFLGDENGLQMLGRIRERFLWLPVLLWTTSVSSELPRPSPTRKRFCLQKTRYDG